MSGENAQRPLVTYDFCALCAVSLLCLCNLAIFYGFYNYLVYLDIPHAWRGPLLALEPLTALALRPYLVTRLTLRNSIPAMRLGTALAVLALASYPFAASVPTIALVRVVHGAGYAILASGLMTAFSYFVSPKRVAQGYGILSLTTLLPSALMPPFVEIATPLLPGPGWAYAMAAPLMLLVLLLLAPMGAKARAMAAALPPEHSVRPGWGQVLSGLRLPGVLGLLVGQFFMVTGHTIVYFFMKSWGLDLGVANPGLFFACANLATIAVRVLGMGLLDGLNPGKTSGLALLFLAGLTPCFALAPAFGSGGEAALLGMAVLYGVALGLCMPLLNAAMYRVSADGPRASNMNLLLLAMDAGFIMGPIIGGWGLGAGLGLPSLFVICGGLMLAAGLFVLPMARLTPATARIR
jgi:MFS family permease